MNNKEKHMLLKLTGLILTHQKDKNIIYHSLSRQLLFFGGGDGAINQQLGVKIASLAGVSQKMWLALDCFFSSPI